MRLRADLTEPPTGYPQMVASLRTMLDRLAAAAPPDDVVADLAGTFAEVAVRLEPHLVDEWSQFAGRLVTVPGRGQALVPPVEFDVHDDHRVRGRLRLGRFHLGGNRAAHGGVLPLVFDDVLGRLANTGSRAVSRTAYLKVDYRAITPIETDLDLTADIVHEEGRKRLVRGTIRAGDVLCAEAEGLFVALRPGQP